MNTIFWKNVGKWSRKHWQGLVITLVWGLLFMATYKENSKEIVPELLVIALVLTRLLFPFWRRGRSWRYHEQEMIRRTSCYQSESSRYSYPSAGSLNGFGEWSAPTDYYYPSTPTNQTFGASSFHSSWQDTTSISHSHNEWITNSSSTFSSFNNG